MIDAINCLLVKKATKIIIVSNMSPEDEEFILNVKNDK